MAVMSGAMEPAPVEVLAMLAEKGSVGGYYVFFKAGNSGYDLVDGAGWQSGLDWSKDKRVEFIFQN
jgi:hypothetical protein